MVGTAARKQLIRAALFVALVVAVEVSVAPPRFVDAKFGAEKLISPAFHLPTFAVPFVAVVLAVVLAIADVGARNALECRVAGEMIRRTLCRIPNTTDFIGRIFTVDVRVTAPQIRDARTVLTLELFDSTGMLITSFVRVVAAVIVTVALPSSVDAVAIVALKFTCCTVPPVALEFVGIVTAVVVSVALQLIWNAFGIGAGKLVRRRTVHRITAPFVSAPFTIGTLVTEPILRDAGTFPLGTDLTSVKLLRTNALTSFLFSYSSSDAEQ